MSTLRDLFGKIGVPLYQNESFDLDRYYQEPYQDNEEDVQDQYDMKAPFETVPSKQKRKIIYPSVGESNFAFFMDGTRKTYKIGDIIMDRGKIYPVVVAQVRAGCTVRLEGGKVHKHILDKRNLLLITSRLNDSDFTELRLRILQSQLARDTELDVVRYKFDRLKDIAPTNAAIAKANSVMHGMEISILERIVKTKDLKTNRMLIVDGPLQFLKEDNGKDSFADMFYNVVGVSKSFDPMLPMSENTRGGAQIGSQLVNLEYAERTPVFYKKNKRGRIFGCWYLRIREKKYMRSPLEGIVKIEKMALREDLECGFNSDIIDNLSYSILKESIPTCHGQDLRWAVHLYPVYLTETMIKSSFQGDFAFVQQFRKHF